MTNLHSSSENAQTHKKLPNINKSVTAIALVGRKYPSFAGRILEKIKEEIEEEEE